MPQITIDNVGRSKIQVIKVVRQYTGASLSEAKQFLDAVDTDSFAIISDVPKNRVATLLAELAGAGASVQEGTRGRRGSFAKQLTYREPVVTPKEIVPAAQNTKNLPSTRYQAKPVSVSPRSDASLKGYLHDVSALEVQAYTQMRLINSLIDKTNRLGKNKLLKEPKKPDFSCYNLFNKDNFYCMITMSMAISVGGMATFILIFVGFELALLLLYSIAAGFLYLALIPDRRDYKRELRYYEQELCTYQNEKAADAVRVKHELLVKEEVEHQIRYAKMEYARTRRTLDAVYSLGIIHPNYRNLVAMCSFYDYFDKGICYCLAGPHGAYKFYEEALRFRRIETRLDVIINKLDEILDNQQQLARLIQEGNSALRRIEQGNNQMAATLNSIQENTAATAYNTHCAAHSAAVMESIAVYRAIKYS